MILALLSLAPAQQPVALTSRATQLQPCLDDVACEAWFSGLLSESLLEYGFLFQHDAVGAGALGGKGNGFVFELHVDSASFGEPNLITERVRVPPVLPRLEIGWQVGSYTYDDPYPQFAASVYAFPPIRSEDSGLFSVGGSASAAVPLGTHLLWAGAELDLSYGHVFGPMLGDGDRLEDIDLIAGLVTLDEPPCSRTEAGCIDRFRSLAPTARLGLSVEPAPPVFFYGKLGLAWVVSSLDVAYDRSRWVVRGLQPQVSYGGGVRFGDRIQLALGGVTAPKPARLSTDASRSLTRVVAAFALRLGAERYWERATVPPVDSEAEAKGLQRAP